MLLRKRVGAFALSLAFCLSLLPVGALAADDIPISTKTITLGTASISLGDTVYFGTEGRQWAVLSLNGISQTVHSTWMNSTGTATYSNGTNPVDAEDAMFLLLNGSLFQSSFDDSSDVYYTPGTTDGSGTTPEDSSTLRDTLLSAASNTDYFSIPEQAAMLKTTKSATSGYSTISASYGWRVWFYSAPLQDDTLFALSKDEYDKYVTSTGSNDDDQFGNTYEINEAYKSIGSDYWLRTYIESKYDDSGWGSAQNHGPYYINSSGDLPCKVSNGSYSYSSKNRTASLSARPAFNLDKNAVLFASSPTGKDTTGMGFQLIQTADYDGTQWKLTLKDSERSDFTASLTDNVITYSGAKTGNHEFLSAIVVDSSDNILYYGRIKSLTENSDAAGTADIHIPVDMSDKTLYVFNEQYNGTGATDYASNLVKLESATQNANPSSVSVTVTPDGNNVRYGSEIAIEATIQKQAITQNALSAFGTVDFYLGNPDDSKLLGSADVTNDGGSYSATLKYTISNTTNIAWTLGANTITAVYSGWIGDDVMLAGTGTLELTVVQGQAPAPSAPTAAKRTSNSITLNALPQGEYGTTEYGYATEGNASEQINNWQTDTTFSSLTSGTEYVFYARYTENDYYAASQVSAGATLSTVKEGTSNTIVAGETITLSDGIRITNEGTKITVDKNGETVLSIAPAPEGGLTVDENGICSIPDGSKVQIGWSNEFVIDGNGVTANISAGAVTLPGGVTATIEGYNGVTTTITPPTDGATLTYENGDLKVPGGTKVQTGECPAITLGEQGGFIYSSSVRVPGGGTATIGGDTIGEETTIKVPETSEDWPQCNLYADTYTGEIRVEYDRYEGESLTIVTGEGIEIAMDSTMPPHAMPSVDQNGNVSFDSLEPSYPESSGITVKNENTSVTFMPGEERFYEGALTIHPDGTVEVVEREGNNTALTAVVTDGDGNTTTVTIPKEGGEGAVTEDGFTAPAGSSYEHNGQAVTIENGSGTVTSDGDLVLSAGSSASVGNTAVTAPATGSSTITPNADGSITASGNTEVQVGEDTTVTLPADGGTVTPGADGTVTVPGGSTVQTGDGPAITVSQDTSGSRVSSDGSVTLPEGGTVHVGDTTITAPAGGGTVKPGEDDTVTVPGGSIVQTSNGPEITVGQDITGAVGSDGSVTLPAGGTAQVGNTTITVPAGGGTVTPGEDGTVTVPGGSTVTNDGVETTVPDEGGTVKPDTGLTFTITFDSQGGSSVTSQTVVSGGKVTVPTAPTRSGYTFAGWYQDAQGTVAWNFETPVTANLTLYAQWSENSSGGGGSSGGSSSSNSGSVTGSGNNVNVDVSGSSVTTAQMETAVERADQGETITIDASRRSSVTLPSGGLEDAASNENDLTVKLENGDVTLSPEALSAVTEQAGTTVTLTVVPVDTDELNSRQQEAVGDAPVFNLTLRSGSQYITDFDGGLVTVSLPYELPDGQDPDGVVVWYLDDQGNITPCETMYDVRTETVIFTTNHFSLYVIGYEKSAASDPFTDVSASDWFHDAVAYAYENGLMNGMGENEFRPNATTNRAMVVTILYRLAGSPDLSNENLGYPFADVDASSWYSDAVYWARLNGITDGISNTNFDPDGSITREQMAALLYRYADFAGYDVSTGGMSLSEYADVSEISSYAVTAMQWANENGLLTGRTATTLAPKGTATRAEIATILMRFCEDVAS